GNFLAVRIQTFEIAAQDVQRIAQGRQLNVPFLSSTSRNVGSLIEHFLGEQFRTCKFDQIERAPHLLEAFNRLLQEGAVLPVGNEMLKTQLGLFHGGKTLVAYQIERCSSSGHSVLRLPRGLP